MPDFGASGALEAQNDTLAPSDPEALGRGLECPVAATGRILGARWTIEILFLLARPLRFCELQQAVGGVNPRTLSQRLQFLRAEGLVELAEAEGHPRYGLTQAGAHLVPVLEGLRRWQVAWLPIDRPQRGHEIRGGGNGQENTYG
jgi:DNA-binding HxlR family transcriptional regulator